MEQAPIDLWLLDTKLGDEKAFEQLFRYFHLKILRYAYKLSKDPQMSQ